MTDAYLNFPVKMGAPKRTVTIMVGGEIARQFTAALAPDKPDFWAFTDIRSSQRKMISVSVDGVQVVSPDLKPFVLSNTVIGDEKFYDEKWRPQLHFSTRRGWINDPNGLVYYKGEYHLFYQHYPYGTDWDSMHWGHAVSKDLVYWQELPIALRPIPEGTCWSGSAVVDWQNTSGLQTGRDDVLVAFYTLQGPFVQKLAYSNDRGRTWTNLDKPAVPHIAGDNRDPKVSWYAPGKFWVMALYLDGDNYALFKSTDLRDWTKLCDIAGTGGSECPDFFELPVDGDSKNTKWVCVLGSGAYLLGTFDGSNFAKESGPFACHWGDNYYAPQTYNDIPAKDGRRIQMAWMRSEKFPGMPFNQQMSLPVVLSLHSTEDGIRMFSYPIKEIGTLREQEHKYDGMILKPGDNPLAALNAGLYDIDAEFECGKAGEFGFDIFGLTVSYDTARHIVTVHRPSDNCRKEAALKPVNGRVRLRIIVDKTSVEIYANDGRVPMPFVYFQDSARQLSVYAKGGEVVLRRLRVYEMKSAWK